MVTIEFTPEAAADLAALGKFDQQRLIAEIETKLGDQPTTETRQRKRLRPNRLAEWELRVAQFRVFFDVLRQDDGDMVVILAIGVKEGNRLFVHGEEFEL